MPTHPDRASGHGIGHRPSPTGQPPDPVLASTNGSIVVDVFSSLLNRESMPVTSLAHDLAITAGLTIPSSSGSYLIGRGEPEEI